MGRLLQLSGAVIVIISAFIEISNLLTNYNLFGLAESLFFILILLLYIFLSLSAFTNRVLAFLSPIIGIAITVYRLGSHLITVIESFLTKYATASPTIPTNIYYVEIFILLGFIIEFIGAISLKS